VSDIDERRLGEFTVRIDRHLCVGFGDCVDLAPDVFALDGEGIAVVRGEASPVARDYLIAACQSCPVDALVLLDADGVQLAP
jgi:ferredoxin